MFLLLAAVVALLAAAVQPPAASARADDTAKPSARVTFALADTVAGPLRVSLRCGDRMVAQTILSSEQRPTASVPLRAGADRLCRVEINGTVPDGRTDELGIVVRSGDRVVERHLAYAPDGSTASKEFDRGSGDLAVDLTANAMPADEIGTGLRVMTFNIYLGGRLNARAEPGWDEQNRRELLEFVRAEDPDVLFLVETYGAGELIETALNEDQPAGREFTGVRITRDEDLGSNGDNLWLYSRLPVEEVYPPISGENVSTFNFGGARLRLPDGGPVHAFTSWLYHQDSARSAATRAAMENLLDVCRTDSDADVVGTDDVRRVEMARIIVEEYLPTYVTDDSPVLIGGDFNTMSHLDWDARFADAPGHEGLALDWPTTQLFSDAGFVDTFRHVHPDVRRYPGRTMDAVHGYLYAPDRIDFLLARGDDVRVLGSRTLTERMPAHRGSRLADSYPFYSDHAAVVTDLVIRGSGPGFEREVVVEPNREEERWPEPPAGYAVAASELTATADNALPERPADLAVDGDPRTHWATDEISSAPHRITVDLGKVRELTAVRYLPRFESNFGLVLRGVVQASVDGETYTDVAAVDWDRYNRPKDVGLGGRTARFLRLRIDHSSAGPMAAAAELIPYQTTPSKPSEPPEQSRAVIVAPTSLHSDCSPAYAETGTWITSNLAGHDGSPTRYSNEPGATATWSPELPADGEYEVDVWWPDHTTSTTSARYTIHGPSGSREIVVDPTEQMGQWRTVGTWPFAAGTDATVTLTVESGYHRAAAVRFRLVSDA